MHALMHTCMCIACCGSVCRACRACMRACVQRSISCLVESTKKHEDWNCPEENPQGSPYLSLSKWTDKLLFVAPIQCVGMGFSHLKISASILLVSPLVSLLGSNWFHEATLVWQIVHWLVVSMGFNFMGRPSQENPYESGRYTYG